MRRTHHCSELTEQHLEHTVTLVGWASSIRNHGGILFIDLRDREGITQVVIDPSETPELAERAAELRLESVIEVTGPVVRRLSGSENRSLPTGMIEVRVRELTVHNIAEPLPFQIDASADRVNEELRLTYRYLDLRRPKNLTTLRLRHRAVRSVRNYLDEHGFVEVETPVLFKSTPEGAREFLVPSRLNPGQFYALTQSPQQYKQMLMVAGVERYYQIARCFRDEDLRADRQPEFTQIDLEMSFLEREDIYALIEGMLQRLWRETLGVEIPVPFPRMPYHEAMDRFGVDKPDLRFGCELHDVSALFSGTQFRVFRSALEQGGVVKALNMKGFADVTTGELKQLEEAAKSLGAGGLAYLKYERGEFKGAILKFLSEEERSGLQQALDVQEGDIVFFAAGDWERSCTILGRIRLDAAQMMAKRGTMTIDPTQYKFLWVIDFPLMLFDEEQQRYVAAHHPFTAPVPEDVALLDSDPKAVRGQHYDCVLNGVEIAGGSIRIHQPALQKKVFEDVLKIDREVVASRFGYMLEAFRYGAPPHGGIAFGLDRLVAILAGRTSIRDVVAFPKTQKGQELMTGSPSEASTRQLAELRVASTHRES